VILVKKPFFAQSALLLCASFFIFLLVWEAISLWLGTFLFPSPQVVALQLANIFGNGVVWPHIFASLYHVLVGLFFGVLAGVALGFILGLSKLASSLFKPIVELLRPIPPIAWIPIAILWFGLGDASAFFIIFVASFFPMFTNVYFGVHSLPLVFARVSKGFGLSPLQKFWHIVLPFTSPYLLTGLKTAVGFSWMAIIAAEMIASQAGLGYFIDYNRLLLMPENVVGAMVIIGFIGFFFEWIVVYAERKLLNWRSVAYA